LEVSLKVLSTVYHPISRKAEIVNPEKYFTAPREVPVISSSYMATLSQCDPPPNPTPCVLSSFSSSIPGAVVHPKKVRVQALTLGVMRNMVVLGLSVAIRLVAEVVVEVYLLE
jgi:hypothetical protein